MASEEARPALRLVQPGDAPEPAPIPLGPALAIPAPGVLPPSAEEAALTSRVRRMCLSDALQAAYTVCAGCYLADAAIEIYHQAAAHAPPGTFRRGCPPGLKSAEATRAWLGSHVAALRELSARFERGDVYARGADLGAAAAHAGRELDRAVLVAKASTDLKLDDRRAHLFQDAVGNLDEVEAFVERLDRAALKPARSWEHRYLSGTDALGALGARRG